MKRSLVAGDFVEQPAATIVFDGNLPLDTNDVDVIPTDHTAAGPLLQLRDNPLSPKGRGAQGAAQRSCVPDGAHPRHAGMRLRVKTDLGEMTYLLPAIGWVKFGEPLPIRPRALETLEQCDRVSILDVRRGILTIKGSGSTLGHSLARTRQPSSTSR